MGETVFFSRFTGESIMERLESAMCWLREHPHSTLVIEPGVYELSTPLSQQTMDDVLNGRYGENPQDVMFSPDFAYSRGLSLEGQEGTTILADGAVLMIDGFMEPVTLLHCSDITIRGLTIDHKRKPFSMGIISDTEWQNRQEGTGSFTVSFGSDFPTLPATPMPRAAAYDPQAGRFVCYDEYKVTSREWLGENNWRFAFKGLQQNLDGMELYVWHTFHYRPAILMEEAHNIRLQNVTIHSQPGMGVVGHRSSDIHITGLRVVPSAGLHMSTNTDATHFTSCKGTVRIEHSVFEGQGDDSVNIHTYYHTIREADGCSCLIELEAPDKTHTQTADHPDPGDELELTDMQTLACTDHYRVLAHEQIGPWKSRLQLDHSLPENVAGLALANATQMAVLVFADNLCRNHLARGVLVKVKKALIEKNTLTDIVGTGIYVAAESWWLEGLCTTEDIRIRRNRILHCGRTQTSARKHGSGGICVTVDAEHPVFPTHAYAEITDNLIECPEAPHGICVTNVQKADICQNSIISAQESIIID